MLLAGRLKHIFVRKIINNLKKLQAVTATGENACSLKAREIFGNKNCLSQNLSGWKRILDDRKWKVKYMV